MSETAAETTPIEPAPPKRDRGPWGPWATLFFSLLIFLVMAIGQIIVVGAASLPDLIDDPAFRSGDSQAIEALLMAEGGAIGAGLVVGAIPAILLTLLLIRWRKGPSVRAYLALHAPPWRTFALWLGMAALLVVALDLLSYALDFPAPGGMAMFANMPFVLAVAATVVAAPIYEEVLFRGFMLTGLKDTRLGAIGAVGLTAFCWAISHVQYDLFWIATIFAMGIYLGAARLRTGSLYIPIALHMASNLYALVTYRAGHDYGFIETSLLAAPF